MPRVRLLAALTLALCLSLPAAADTLRPKDGWDLLRAVLDGMGLRASVQRIDQGEGGLTLHDVTVRPARSPRGAMLSLPRLRIEPRAQDRLALIPPAEALLTFPPESGMASEIRIHANGEFLLAADSQALDVTSDFTTLELRFTGPAPGATDERLQAEVRFQGLNGTIRMEMEPRINLQGAFESARIEFVQSLWAMTPGARPIVRSDEVSSQDVRIEVALERADLFQEQGMTLSGAFAAGFAAHLGFTAGGSTSDSVQTVEGTEFTLALRNGPSQSRIDLQSGMLSVTGAAADLQIAAGYGELRSDVTIAGIDTGFQMPLVPSDAPRDFSLWLALEAVEADAASWAALGAPGLAGDVADLVLAISGEGRWLAELTDGGPDDTPPLDMAALRLDRLEMRFGRARLEGSGRFEPLPDAPAGGDLPPGTGDFRFVLDGGEALLERLSREGLLPADQMFIARMMLGALARRTGDDRLESEIAIRPDGSVLVNGLPLPF